MTFKHIHQEEAQHVGEPDDASLTEIAGIAPPCDKCQKREATHKHNGRDLCDHCSDHEN
jgi:hypothetical protein